MKGVYVWNDRLTGKAYIGSATADSGGLWSRLGSYIFSGHAGNKLLRELVGRGAQLAFRDGGTAIGAALHGSRHCHHPEGGPTMRTIEEVPRDGYAKVVAILLDAGAEVPDTISESGARSVMLIAELGVDPPGSG